jgi:dihydroorotate dehydrogenase (fumarate)
MVDLSVQWLGLELRSPLVVGASPLSDTAALAHRLVAAGAGAIVLRSLFEEQIVADQLAAHRFFDAHVDINAEARSFLPDSDVFSVASTPTTDRLRALKDAVDVPVLGSLNGVTPGGWVHHARELVEAGADAIELNLYDVATDPGESGEEVERRQLRVVESVVDEVDVPVSVKLSPAYTSVPGSSAGSRPRERRGWCCSTGSTSPTWIWRHSTSTPTWCCPPRPSCPSDSMRSPCCTTAPACRSARSAGCTPAPMR